MQRAIWILWPSFIVAGVAEAVLFTLFDPSDLRLLGQPLELSRLGAYTIGFLGFWMFAATSSALSYSLQKSAAKINGK